MKTSVNNIFIQKFIINKSFVSFNNYRGSKSKTIQELKDRINKKLEKLLAQNPLRVDFYEKYQEIIEQYNLGKEYASVKELFDKLIKLFGELTEEEKELKKKNLQKMN